MIGTPTHHEPSHLETLCWVLNPQGPRLSSQLQISCLHRRARGACAAILSLCLRGAGATDTARVGKPGLQKIGVPDGAETAWRRSGARDTLLKHSLCHLWQLASSWACCQRQGQHLPCSDYTVANCSHRRFLFPKIRGPAVGHAGYIEPGHTNPPGHSQWSAWLSEPGWAIWNVQLAYHGSRYQLVERILRCDMFKHCVFVYAHWWS